MQPAPRRSGLARVADGQHLPLVAVGLVPADHSAAAVDVDFAVDRAAHVVPSDSGGLNAREDGVEIGLADPKEK